MRGADPQPGFERGGEATDGDSAAGRELGIRDWNRHVVATFADAALLALQQII
jgi:hypothetical protein